MPFCLTVRCRQIGSDQIPSHFRPHSPSAHAQNIHVIVFDSLLSRKVIVHQRGANPFHLIGADGCTYPTAADRHAPFHFARDNCVSERDDKVWIVVHVIEDVCAEVGNLVASSTQLRNQLFLKSESTVVSGDSHSHAHAKTTLELGATQSPASDSTALALKMRGLTLAVTAFIAPPFPAPP